MAERLSDLGARVLDLRPWFAADEVPALKADRERVGSGGLKMPLRLGLDGQGPMAEELLRPSRLEARGVGGAAETVIPR